MKSITPLFSIMLLALILSVPAMAGNLDETPEVQFSSVAAQDLFNKATELGSAVKIYEFVRNNYEYALYHGSRSGSINTFLSRRGNDVDFASTLIAMLRSQGIPAVYAVGTIEVASPDLMNWLGVKNLDLAVSIMDDQGIQDVAKSADGSTVQFEHTWVRTQVAFDNYRGAGTAASVNCAANPSQCVWLDIDPSFKLRQYHNQNINVYSAVNFDYNSYYNAILNNNPAVKDKNPLEIYEEQIIAYLQANHPGKTLEDVADPGVIIKEENQILPASLPYVVVGPVAVYDSVSAHDVVTPKRWGKKARVSIDMCVTFNVPPISLVDLSTHRFTYTYELGVTERVVFRLDNTDYYVPTYNLEFNCNGVPIELGSPFSMTIEVDGAPGTHGGSDRIISVTYDNLVVGGYYLIGTGGDSSNWSQVHRAAEQLLAANVQYPIINDPAGEPYVDDSPANGMIDAGELRLLDHPSAQDALTGGLLYSAMTLYFARFYDNLRRLDNLNHVISPIEGFVGVVSTVYDVEYLDQTAFSVMPGGLLIDMKGQKLTGTWRTNAPEDLANVHAELVGYSMSSLEHEIWQEITGFDAVSTVRGTQMAVGNNGATVLNPKKNQTENTLAAFYSGVGFGTQAPIPWVKHERTIFSTAPVSWSHPNNNQAMDIFKSNIDPNTPSLQRQRFIYTYPSPTSGPEAWLNCVDSKENQLQGYIAQGLGNNTINITYCDGSTFSGTVFGALAQLQTLYETTIIPNNIGQNYMAYFDKNRGFVPSDYVYREAVVPGNYHPASVVQQFRDNISLITADRWLEYIIPSRKTSGTFFQFSVYVDKVHDLATNNLINLSFKISNESLSAGGGYVDGAETLSPATSITTFNNELFNNQTLNTAVNNDLIKTPSTVDPVSTITGNMYHDETDIVVKGRGLNIAFTRTYNSSPAKEDTVGLPLGYNWTHSYNMKLKANDFGQYPNYPPNLAPLNNNGKTSSITYVDERGGEVNYLVNDAGASPSWQIIQPKGVFDSLQLNVPSAGYYTLAFRNGTKYVFTGPDLKIPGNIAVLHRIEDPFGNQLSFGYTAGKLTSITDNLGIAGRTGLTLTYFASNRLKEITDWTGRQWIFAYNDVSGNLISVTNPLGDAIEYTYHPGTHLMENIVLPEDRDGDNIGGDVVTEFNYYRNGKAFSYVNAMGEAETLDYDLYRKRTRVTDPRGFIRQHFYDQDGVLTKLMEPDGAILLFKHNPDLLRYQKSDGLGFSTTYSYRLDRSLNGGASDTYGNVTRERDAMGYNVDYTYDYNIFDQVTQIVDKNGKPRTFTYYTTTNAATGAVKGKLQNIKATLNGTANVLLKEYTYYSNGQIKQKTEYIDASNPGRKRITTYTWDAAGLNLQQAVVSGSGQSIQISYGYDNLGRRTSETLTRRTSATDSAFLQLTTVYEYDVLDRVTKVTDAVGNVMETVYDKNGKVKQVIGHYKRPDGTFDIRTIGTNEYDFADRLAKETDIYGNSTLHDYDEAGNLIRVTDANGHATRYEYDAMGRRTAVIDANGHRAETIYDLGGRVMKTIDASGNATQYEYDALGRRTSRVDALGYVTQWVYDGNGNVTKIIDANAVAGLQPKNSYLATVYQEYDERNRLKKIVDAQNSITLHAYDLLGNVTQITDAENRVSRFIYDDLGRPTEVRDPLIESPTDKVTRFTWDEAGNLLTKTDRKGQIARYTYDRLNRMILTEYLTDGASEARTYDIYGNLESVSNADVTYTYTYDLKSRPISKTDSRLNKSLIYGYDAVGNVLQKTDYQGDVTDYRYDSTNRLVSLRNPTYLEVSYHYDPAGRLLDRIMSNGARIRYSYDANGRITRVDNVSADGSDIHHERHSYDNISNILDLTDNIVWTGIFTYDPTYRLINADYFYFVTFNGGLRGCTSIL